MKRDATGDRCSLLPLIPLLTIVRTNREVDLISNLAATNCVGTIAVEREEGKLIICANIKEEKPTVDREVVLKFPSSQISKLGLHTRVESSYKISRGRMEKLSI